MSQASQQQGLRRGFGVGAASSTLVAFLVLLVVVALQAPAAFSGSVPCDCESCHGDFHGENWQGCSGCHESPPQTGSHRSHYDSDPLTIMRYGDTTVRSTADAYMFGCGNCHPLDRALHRDGTVQVELYNVLAPAGSIKAKNAPEAAYESSTQTCSNVYCHSGVTVTSGPVGLPLTSPPNAVPPGNLLNGPYIMDGTCSNLTYDPYTVNVGRSYATSPPWGTTGSITTCTECHEFPLTTYYPTVYAGVGDSHQWVDDWGYNWRHAWNMIGTPLPCKTCHISTVTQAGGTAYGPTGQGGAWITSYDPVPIASHAMHVNGTADVGFDVSYVYGSGPRAHTYSLASATYDPATKTCSNVTCHYNPNAVGSPQLWQNNVKWGAPWRDERESGAECDVCHRYGYLSETCQPAP